MGKFHISPKTGLPAPCRASKRACPVGGEHYATREAAEEALQKAAGSGTLPKPKRRRPTAEELRLDAERVRVEYEAKRARARQKAREAAERERAEQAAARQAWVEGSFKKFEDQLAHPEAHPELVALSRQMTPVSPGSTPPFDYSRYRWHVQERGEGLRPEAVPLDLGDGYAPVDQYTGAVFVDRGELARTFYNLSALLDVPEDANQREDYERVALAEVEEVLDRHGAFESSNWVALSEPGYYGDELVLVDFKGNFEKMVGELQAMTLAGKKLAPVPEIYSDPLFQDRILRGEVSEEELRRVDPMGYLPMDRFLK